MKKYILPVLGIVALVSAVVATANSVYADFEGNGSGGFGGRMRHGLEAIAEFLGMDVDELQEAKQDKTVLEIVEEQGKTKDEFHEFMEDKARQRWQEMGLSEEEIAERLQMMEERHENCGGPYNGSPFGKGYGRFHHLEE